ncbi:hypothetical protein ABDK56_11855 [Sphingomonas sp. ASV193]|uniref:hypothetical protein n=1 Tax=Sphingomonas sp. ASV193 TaxID=3144405 RepID=UPI0032E8920E
MNPTELGRIFDNANAAFDDAGRSRAKVDGRIARADAVMRQLDQRDGSVRDAARRERQRLNAGLGTGLKRIATGLLVLAGLMLVIGLIKPIGMIGFFLFVLAALAMAGVVAGSTILGLGKAKAPPAPTLTPELSNARLIDEFDSYLFRVRHALPAPAQAEVDAILARLPALKPAMDRLPPLDPSAQDARRLMGTHLPGLIDRYLRVPAERRAVGDGGDASVDQRLAEALHAGREALGDVCDQIAAGDVAAFDTQGRFIKSKYGDSEVEA